MLSHSEASEKFISDAERTDWHDETLWFVRAKRDKASKVLPEWEAMREHASQIKDHTLANLGEYLQAFEAKAIANGIHVHWAADAAEHNAIVHSIIAAQGSKTIVKSKSMLTEECHLNDYLASKGIEVVDTDLGERIVQFRNEAPSHIVLPAIHLKKEDVGETFHQHLGTPKGNKDPQFLTEAARQHLRGHFLASEVAITGVNFAVAETGEFVVCTNEGNADMGAHLANVHIACTGIEKIIPKRADLAVFLRLLARSATGQLITTYSSHFHKPREGQEMHIILLDNGRTRQLADPKYKNSLKCIRCAACFNTCPVYRRSGGHSYHQPVAGPIGSILAPNIDKKANADLPFASTLCGSCSNVCPVKINIHEQLWFWRQDLMEAGLAPVGKTIGMKLMAFTLANPVIYRLGGSLMRRFSGLLNSSLNPWYKQREMPVAPKESFQEWYKKTMSARDQILGKIEPLAEVKHPGDFSGASIDLDFKASLEVVGARVVSPEELEHIFPNRQRFEKTQEGLSLAEVEVLEIDGEFGVAENGAIWLTEEALPHRVAPFICQHLVIHVQKIVPHMHAAYEELKKPSSSFGLFLAGPSKTADIEQSLVIGAHGARSLTVVIRA